MQRPPKRFVFLLAISAVVGLAGILMNFIFLPLLRLENYTKDLRAVFGRKTPVAADIVLLTIDQASIRLDGLLDDEIHTIPEFALMQEGWPWPRSVHAALLEKLMKAGARVVAFDLLFPGPGRGDADFSSILQRYSDQAIIGGTFTGVDTPVPSFSVPSDTLLTQGKQDAQIGFANFVPDDDGIVRSAIFRAAPEDFVGRKRTDGTIVFNSLAASILHLTDPKLKLPDTGSTPFRFSGEPGTYPHFSVYQVFLPSFWHSNFQDGAFFKNKIVVVGPEGHWSHDEHPTPFTSIFGTRGLMSGPEVHLHALAAARAGEFIHLPGPWLAAGIIALAAAIGALLNGLSGTSGIRFGAFLLLVIVYWMVAQWLFNNAGFLVPLAAPIVVLSLTVFGGILFDLSRERFERQRVRATLERYVSGHVAKEILDSPQSYLTSLVGVRKEVTVLFADLRNFTAMVNMLNAQELVAQLNEYYARVIEDVFHHGGTLDKIMGDGMMAVWGNLRSDGVKEDAVNAVRAALAIQSSLKTLNAEWLAQGRPQLALGIGIAHGECVVGNIGSERKMDLTVIGDAANLAARLQSLTRERQEEILISGDVAKLVEGEFSLPLVSTETIRGFEKAIEVHSVATR
ncbi:MAG: adenylate/guanylate cyclase domain-containing protein [Chthoniobacterales bacterium]